MADEPTLTEQDSKPALRSRLFKAARRLLVIILITYAGVCLLVACFQGYLIYFPDRKIAATPQDVGLSFDEVTLHTSDGVELSAWYLPCPEAKATVLFCHGNAGNIGDRLHSIHVLHHYGYAVLIFDYRGFGQSEGHPTETGTYRDAEAAWQYLVEDRAVPPQRLVIFGRSLGGAVAIDLALRHTPAALVVESTFTSLADVGGMHYPLLPVKYLIRYRYDSAGKVGSINCPKLFLHGQDDRLIPIALGRQLFEAAAAPKQFIETPGNHVNAGYTYTTEYAEKLVAFVDNALAGNVP